MKTPRIIVAAAAIAAIGTHFSLASASQDTTSVSITRATHDGHPYQNGGISKEQVADIEHHIKPYDLHLTFSEGKHNAYAAGLKLQITDAKGHPVFALDDAGPLTDVNLPAGHYRVVADFGGVKRSGSVEVKPGEPAELYLHWPKDET
jgi:hypothetical protein